MRSVDAAKRILITGLVGLGVAGCSTEAAGNNIPTPVLPPIAGSPAPYYNIPQMPGIRTTGVEVNVTLANGQHADIFQGINDTTHETNLYLTNGQTTVELIEGAYEPLLSPDGKHLADGIQEAGTYGVDVRDVGTMDPSTWEQDAHVTFSPPIDMHWVSAHELDITKHVPEDQTVIQKLMIDYPAPQSHFVSSERRNR